MKPTNNHTIVADKPGDRPPDRSSLELYQVIIHCRDEAQQRELYHRLRREGHRCRLTVL